MNTRYVFTLCTVLVLGGTNAGVVSLTGEVQDLITSANVSWTAWQVAGVQSVKNDLTVKK